MSPLLHRRNDCRMCGSPRLVPVLSLEPTPIGDAYVPAEALDDEQPIFPIDVFLCDDCGLAQLRDVIDPVALEGDGLYIGAAPVPADATGEAEAVLRRTTAPTGALAVDLGSHDRTLALSLRAGGMDVIGVEPSATVAAGATAIGIPTRRARFSRSVAQEVRAEFGPARLVLASQIAANVDTLHAWLDAVDALLARDGVLIIESISLGDVLAHSLFDSIYHEHLSTFSAKPVDRWVRAAGFEVAAIEHLSSKGGSFRYYVQRPGGPVAVDGSVAAWIEREESDGMYRPETYARFSERIRGLKQRTAGALHEAKRAGKSVVGFGASVSVTTLIYQFGIGHLLDHLVDDNPSKQGRFSPGWHLPVRPTSALYDDKPDVVAVLAWRFADTIVNRHRRYLEHGGTFVIPAPQFQVIQ